MNPTKTILPEINFRNTAAAFISKSDADLKKARFLFSLFNQKWLINLGPKLAEFAFSIGLPIGGLIKNTIFKQFVGGENIEDCHKTIQALWQYKVGTILDYSVEGAETTESFESTKNEVIRTIISAAKSEAIPFSVFKVTGIGPFHILEKLSDNSKLNSQEQAEANALIARFNAIVEKAVELKVRLFIDAEETWIQPAIDNLAEEAMKKYNTHDFIIYNTVQLYRHDRLQYLKTQIQKAKEQNYLAGFKLVRGAYMEKERKRAEEKAYPSPIQPDKKSADADYNEALKYCVENAENVAICAGTHNEESTLYLAQLMAEKAYNPNDKRFFFAQLLGMSDHISFNLSQNGYNVAKYVPYGPVRAVLPYLTRRAQENSSVAGQTGRELSLIETELLRRKAKS